MNLILIAPPAAGKGTISELLKEKYSYNHISPGELFRELVKQDTELGSTVKAIMDSGEMVDDKITKQIIENKMKTFDLTKPFVIDGYVRTPNQIADFENIMKNLGTNIDKAIYIDIDKETGLKRKLSRLICPNCKRGYSKLNKNLIPKEEGKCDDCKVDLISRTDDTKEAYEALYEIFLKDTVPVIEYFEKLGKLVKIDGQKSPEEVFSKIEKIIGEEND